MGEFCMPSLGADMEAGTLVEWLKAPGEPVTRGDVIAVVETQKGAIEIEVFESGLLDEVLVEPGTKVPVGTPLAYIRDENGPPAAPKRLQPERGHAPQKAAPEPKAAGVPAPEPAPVPTRAHEPAPSPAMPARRRISPAARRLAAGKGVDLAALVGSGPGGAVVRADIARALEGGAAKAAEKLPRTGIDLVEMRKAIAAAMARSKREIPHYYLASQVDLKAATAWLAAQNAARPPTERLLMVAIFLRAVALALKEVPELNGHTVDGVFRKSEAIHVGAAIALRGGGLVAPAIHDTDRLSLDEVMTALRDMVARVRKGRIRSSEMVDPTITVTSLGERGVETVYGVIYPPQVAIVGFGRVTDAPRAVDGAIGVHPTVTVTLAADHRTSDGHRGAIFLEAVGRLLQEPDQL